MPNGPCAFLFLPLFFSASLLRLCVSFFFRILSFSFHRAPEAQLRSSPTPHPTKQLTRILCPSVTTRTAPSSPVRKIRASLPLNLSNNSGLGCPYGFCSPAEIIAICGPTLCRKSGIVEFLNSRRLRRIRIHPASLKTSGNRAGSPRKCPNHPSGAFNSTSPAGSGSKRAPPAMAAKPELSRPRPATPIPAATKSPRPEALRATETKTKQSVKGKHQGGKFLQRQAGRPPAKQTAARKRSGNRYSRNPHVTLRNLTSVSM
jgi:hypothetical protein